MPGQQNVYDTAMADAANYAWDHEWEQAIEAYLIALNEFPGDTEALAGLGLALVETERLEDALQVYDRIIRISPDDPFALEHSAQVLERMGRYEEAGQQYIAVADIYVSLRNIDRAIANWERAVSLMPDEIKMRSRLAVAYERTDQTALAVQEYQTIASIFQRMADLPKAAQVLQRALKLDPTNDQVRDNLTALRKGASIELPSAIVPARPVSEDFDPFSDDTSIVQEAHDASHPLAQISEQAMSMLAELLFDSELSETALAFMAEAIEAHRSGDPTRAAEAYHQAIRKGVNHPAAWFNNGVTYIQAGNLKDGANALKSVMQDPDYALATNLALGEGYLAENKLDQAMYHLVEAIHHAELEMTPNQKDQLDTDYAAAHEELKNEGDSKRREMSKALVAFFSGREWQSRLAETRSMVTAGQADNIIKGLTERGAGKVAESIELIDHYMSEGKLLVAMELAYQAINSAPSYIPLHTRIADILVLDKRASAAADKFNIIANTLLVRGEMEKAADVFARVLQLSPMDLPARRRLTDMLIEQNRISAAITHYMETAETYLTMADTAAANQTYNTAIALARQSSDIEPTQIAELLYRIADLEMQQLNWREALQSYEEIKDILPGDEKAALAIVDLHFNLGKPQQAITQLDEFLGYLISHNMAKQVVSILEAQVRDRADDIALRQRLAKVYQEQKRIPDAIAQMDALGELFLEAGKQDEAVATIQQIVDLNPPDVEGYRQLLEQLE